MIARLLGILIIGAAVFMVIWFYVHMMARWRRRELLKEAKMKEDIERERMAGAAKKS